MLNELEIIKVFSYMYTSTYNKIDAHECSYPMD